MQSYTAIGQSFDIIWPEPARAVIARERFFEQLKFVQDVSAIELGRSKVWSQCKRAIAAGQSLTESFEFLQSVAAIGVRLSLSLIHI